jgi:hypothetical protein
MCSRGWEVRGSLGVLCWPKGRRVDVLVQQNEDHSSRVSITHISCIEIMHAFVHGPDLLHVKSSTCRALFNLYSWPANSICSADITSIINDTGVASTSQDLFYLCASFTQSNTYTSSVSALFSSIPVEYEGISGSVQDSIHIYYLEETGGDGFWPFIYHYYSCRHPRIQMPINTEAGIWYQKRIKAPSPPPPSGE